MDKRIIELVPSSHEWKQFLTDHDHLIHHTPLFYSFIEKTFRQKLLYLGVVDNKNRLTLVFPSVLVHHPLFGRKIISTGYLEYGGFAGKPEDVPLVFDYLKQNYNHLSYVEIRQGLEKFDMLLPRYTKTYSSYKRFLLPLGPPEKIWLGIQKYKRKAIKKAESDGITIRELDLRDIPVLYSLYLKNMRSFGSPPYSEHFFINFLQCFMGKIFGAFFEETLVAALVGYCYQERIHVVIAVSDERYLAYRPNDAVHWAFIKYGCENNYAIFDFGRTREGSGQHEYKEKFGAIMYPLNHYYLLFEEGKIPHIDPNEGKMKIAASVWKHLPLIITRKMGHWLREGLGI